MAIEHQHALHNEGELTTLLALLASVQPATILEIGTWRGGSAWAWSQLPSVKHIVTVDIAPQQDADDRLAGLPCKVSAVVGDSRHPETHRQVEDALGDDKADVVVIDAGHLYHQARHDLEWYSKHARTGGLIVMHDTQGYPGNDAVQVHTLWAELRAVYRTTELTDKPGGPGGTGVIWL